jgi:hypothetical protein
MSPVAGIPYDPEYIARFYDEYEGDREWNRFDASPMDRVGLMSLLGAARAFFASLPPLVEEFGWERAVEDVFRA